jgi:hypothetical protein
MHTLKKLKMTPLKRFDKTNLKMNLMLEDHLALAVGLGGSRARCGVGGRPRWWWWGTT